MTKYNNPLPEFCEDDGRLVRADFVDAHDLWVMSDEGEEADWYPDREWYDKIHSLIGQIVVQFNSLEDTIENCILGIMNNRGEDARVWVFLERMSTRQKSDALFRLYEVSFNVMDVLATNPTRLQATHLKREFDSINARRNLYVHANWSNIATNETRKLFVEHKTKRTQDGYYGRIRRNITIAEMIADVEQLRVIEAALYDLEEQYFHLENLRSNQKHISIVQGDVYSADTAITWPCNIVGPDLSNAELVFITNEPFESVIAYHAEGPALTLDMSKEDSSARRCGIYTYEVRANVDGKTLTIASGQMVVRKPEKTPPENVLSPK